MLCQEMARLAPSQLDQSPSLIGVTLNESQIAFMCLLLETSFLSRGDFEYVKDFTEGIWKGMKTVINQINKRVRAQGVEIDLIVPSGNYYHINYAGLYAIGFTTPKVSVVKDRSNFQLILHEGAKMDAYPAQLMPDTLMVEGGFSTSNERNLVYSMINEAHVLTGRGYALNASARTQFRRKLKKFLTKLPPLKLVDDTGGERATKTTRYTVEGNEDHRYLVERAGGKIIVLDKEKLEGFPEDEIPLIVEYLLTRAKIRYELLAAPTDFVASIQDLDSVPEALIMRQASLPESQYEETTQLDQGSAEISEEEAEVITDRVSLINNIYIDPNGGIYATLALYGARSKVYVYLQNKIRKGRLHHVKGLRGMRGEEEVKLYELKELHSLAEEYSQRIPVDAEGMGDIDGRTFIGLPSYLIRQGFSSLEAHATIEKLQKRGVVQMEHNIISGKHSQAGFWLDEAYRHLPVKIKEGVGRIWEPKKTQKKGTPTALKKVKVLAPGLYARAHNMEARRFQRQIDAVGDIERIERRAIGEHGGGASEGVYRVADVRWLLPQYPNIEGIVDLLMRDGRRRKALALGKILEHGSALKKAAERALKKADVEYVPDVCVLAKPGSSANYKVVLLEKARPVLNALFEKRGESLRV